MYSWKNSVWWPASSETASAFADGMMNDAGYGIIAGTKVATTVGWRPVEAITAGDKVLTFDAGLQTVIEVRRQLLYASATLVPKDNWPLHVPAGALGNRAEMQILPGQNILIESDTAEDIYGDPFVLLPAAALEGFNGISRLSLSARVEVVSLHFAQDQIVHANIGALFLCPRASDLMHDLYAVAEPSAYRLLSMDEADDVLAGMEASGMSQSVHA